ncbi:hypothetical protein Dimus_032672 [Dionaea muscipula]
MDPSKKRRADVNGSSLATNDNNPDFPSSTSPSSLPPSSLTPEDARKLLEPLSSDQLLSVLQDAVLRHQDVLLSVRSVADQDTSRRKLFVRGLGGETTTDTLRSLFSTYGELDEAIVITDKATGRSKGFGFVTFKHVDGAVLALREPSKRIDGRMSVTHLAAAGSSGGPNADDLAARKIYVGNIPFEISAEKLLDYFSVYGEVEEGPLGFDKHQGKLKGFAFFVYKTEEGARESIVEPIKVIDGHQLICKLAVDGKKGKPNTPGSAPSGLGEFGGERMGAVGVPNLGPGSYNSQFGGPTGFGYGAGPYQTGPAGYGHQGGFMGSALPSTQGGQVAYGVSPYGGGDHAAAYRMPPTSMGMNPTGYQESTAYGLNPTGFSMQQYPPSQGPPQGPPGGMYQRTPPY